MPNLSFGWTSQLLPPNGCKDTTRRLWADRTVAIWQKAWDTEPEKLHPAWNQCSFVKGSRQIGIIKLIERPFLEPLRKITDGEIAREGHPELTREEFIDKYFWHPRPSWDQQRMNDEWIKLMKTEFCVVRFEYTEVDQSYFAYCTTKEE